MKSRLFRLASVITLFTLLISLASTNYSVQAREPKDKTAPASSGFDVANADASASSNAKASHRLIVELESPALAVWSVQQSAKGINQPFDVKSAASQAYITQLRTEQAAFINTMQKALPAAKVDAFINEQGVREVSTYQVVFNGMTVDPGKTANRDQARQILLGMPGVKNVYLDYAHTPNLYASNELINSPALWNHPEIGGRMNAGEGIKFASVDGGVHKDAPMFSGEGYSYPPGFPVGGLGHKENNNGKIIASRVYFRAWDPPAPGDDNPWPGENGTSHGVHTSGIAAGNVVTATYLGLQIPNMSGVAPRAWVMSYRVFYESITGDGSFYNAEGIAALEDVAVDGADVVNNSWGGGPVSTGGEFDALDQALINLSAAQVFVSMSAGNSGPDAGTTDHPSDDYIIAAATTTSGTLASGRLSITAPTPISPTLQNRTYATGELGGEIEAGSVFTATYKAAANVDPANINGCDPWPAGTFTGHTAVIQRGGCEFGVKALNAQNAGAVAVVVYNSVAGGEGLINMAEGVVGNQVTIPSIFVQRSTGVGMVAWQAENPNTSVLEINTVAFQAGSTPDVLASFSSRGPGVGDVLKPDIAAPGVNILSQGFTPNTAGEARHLGYGQASGTSMAAPHVAGAAVLVRQIHPTWTNKEIKSALMTTSKYTDVYTLDGAPAQPLDMGAGRLDLTHVADPGVIVNPVNLSFGRVVTATTESIQVTVRSVASATETYNLSMLYTGDGFDAMTDLAGYTVTPASITVAPGASATVTVTFNADQGQGYGDNQGYLILDGTTHDAHLPVWSRVMYAENFADVLVIDNDASTTLSNDDYVSYYTDALEQLGYTYDVWDADDNAGNSNTIPDVPTLSAYDTVIYFTGDNYQPDGTFTVATPLTLSDMNRLTEYANGGGHILAMGQDLSAVLQSDSPDDSEFFYDFVLGATWLQDSVTDALTPTLPIVAADNAPNGFQDIVLDLGEDGDGAGNQLFIDELETPTRFTNPDETSPIADLVPLLKYPGPYNEDRGLVALAHRDQPTLERLGVSYEGSSIYATFGLEGVNNTEETTSRAELLDHFIQWGTASASVVISDTTTSNASNLTTFTANLTSNISGTTGYSYRWDFGDGTAFTSAYPSQFVSHTYERCGVYQVRVEVTDDMGHKTIGTMQANITSECTIANTIYLPMILR